MHRRIFLYTLLCCLMVVGSVFAQSGGQLWVRAFEDRNENGVRDQGEPFITGGVAVNLVSEDGVIIASARLEESPNASQGLVGFQLLPPGQYTVVVTSADFEATNQETFTTTVSDTGLPPVLEYGARPLEVEVVPVEDVAATQTETQLLVAVAGAAAVICIMALLGFLVYVFVLRRRLKQAQALDQRITTGSMRPVTVTGTGEFAKSDTGRFRPAGTGEFRNPPDTGEYPKA